MVKRAAEIAAYRGDWLQTGGKIAENEQPGSQSSERMGSKTGGKIANKNSQDRSIARGFAQQLSKKCEKGPQDRSIAMGFAQKLFKKG